MQKNDKLKFFKYACLPNAILLIVIIVIVFAYSNGYLFLNNPSVERYPVRGVDVSHYQSPIDWQTLVKDSGIDFAFIKATEGSSYKDEYFSENWKGSKSTGIYSGAYHFFSFDSAGKSQAENFIETVPYDENSLPPVIDIEFYSGKNVSNTQKEDVKPILDELIAELKEYYGKSPILYLTQSTYEYYIKDDSDYNDNPIWIRSVIRPPSGNSWSIWQYTDKMSFDGYSGDEKFIDMNTYNGTLEDFKKEFALT